MNSCASATLVEAFKMGQAHLTVGTSSDECDKHSHPPSVAWPVQSDCRGFLTGSTIRSILDDRFAGSEF